MSNNCVELNEIPHHVGGFIDRILRAMGLKKDPDAELIEFIVRGPVACSLGWTKEEVSAELEKWCDCENRGRDIAEDTRLASACTGS